MRFVTAATGAGLAIAALAAAPLAAQDYDAARVKKSVTQADLLAVVGSLGHQVIEEGKDGEVLVIAESPDQITYFLFGTACDVNNVPGCQGIMMQARFDLPPSTTPETLAAANMDQAALNTWADFTEKTLGFTRYQVLDDGVTMANIRANVDVLLSLIPEAYPVAAGESAPAAD
jgi:hypothetical protein